jgi:hypothetical protein
LSEGQFLPVNLACKTLQYAYPVSPLLAYCFQKFVSAQPAALLNHCPDLMRNHRKNSFSFFPFDQTVFPAWIDYLLRFSTRLDLNALLCRNSFSSETGSLLALRGLTLRRSHNVGLD